MISHFYLQKTSFRQHAFTLTASDYARNKGASEDLLTEIRREEKDGLRMEAIQMAITSVEFLLHSLLLHLSKDGEETGEEGSTGNGSSSRTERAEEGEAPTEEPASREATE